VPVNEASEILALALIFAVHVAGGLMLVWGMLDAGSRPGWDPCRRRRDDDGPGGDPPAPRPSPPPLRAPLPLPGADPSDVRLRGEERLRDAYPRPPRRPQREPLPEREPLRR
jgi:hypothetical protein